MENLEKPQNCQNWGVGACPGQHGTCTCMYDTWSSLEYSKVLQTNFAAGSNIQLYNYVYKWISYVLFEAF